MSAPTYSDFAARFPELATSVTASQTWIGTALSREWARLDPGFWDNADDRTEAALLRAAHHFSLRRAAMEATGASKTLPTGALTSESAGDWSRGYSAPSNSFSSSSQQDFGRTAYGQEYLTLCESRPSNVDRVSL